MKTTQWMTAPLLCFCSISTLASEQFSPITPGLTQTTMGGTGLILMPSARHRDEGYFSFNYMDNQEYRFWSASVQLYPWLETTIRYSDVRYKYFSDDPSFSGDQTYKDKGIDVKFRLWQESMYVPEISLGFRDFGGTGLFESEYFAASKRLGPVDVTLGIGWGYLGHKENITNPACKLSDSFCSRQAEVGTGGSIKYENFFHGPASFYAGVEYQTPWAPLRLKAEYDGNDYQHELTGAFKVDSDFNFAAVYAVNDAFDITMNYQRGNTFGFGFSYAMNFHRLTQIKLDDAPRKLQETRPQTPLQSLDKQTLARSLYQDAGFVVLDYRFEAEQIILLGYQVAFRDETVAMERISRVLASELPQEIKHYRVVIESSGMPQVETKVDADSFVSAATYQAPGLDVKDSFSRMSPKDYQYSGLRKENGFGYGADMFWVQTFGSPENFYMYQVGLLGNLSYQFSNHFSLNTTAKLNVLTNFDEFNFKVDSYESAVPRVRTYIREYVTRSDFTMENFYGQWRDKVSENWYAQAYAGYLEMMFGGAGAEFLYRPVDTNWYFGFDINYVKQRSYEEELRFFDYSTFTGHASLYWQPTSKWLENTLITASVGQYLAKDKGVTVEFAKRFDSGIVVGAYAAFTDMTSAEYGEGSFTKGFYLSLPFDLFSLKSSMGRGRLPWIPISRDGGQMLNRPMRLSEVTEVRSPFIR